MCGPNEPSATSSVSCEPTHPSSLYVLPETVVNLGNMADGQSSRGISTAKWWCPCCRRPRRDMACKLLKARSPCRHCGNGHSHKACPHQHRTYNRVRTIYYRRGAAPIAVLRQLPNSPVSDAVPGPITDVAGDSGQHGRTVSLHGAYPPKAGFYLDPSPLWSDSSMVLSIFVAMAALWY
jgi:hypothetical protein